MADGSGAVEGCGGGGGGKGGGAGAEEDEPFDEGGVLEGEVEGDEGA